jgi:ketosteroid isomerase-like protein
MPSTRFDRRHTVMTPSHGVIVPGAASLPPSFSAVADALKGALRRRVRDVHTTEHGHLAAWFDRPDEAIDYERYADAFAVSYLLPNYWKAAHALYRASPPATQTIVDLGAGSGAATWAALAWLASVPDRHEPPDIHLFDRSARSLTLARELGKHVLNSLPNLRVRLTVEKTDLREHPQLPADSLILMSHVLTEHRTELEPVLSSIVRGSLGRGVLIVERKDDEVWRHIDKVTNQWGMPSQSEHLHIEHAVESLIPAAQKPGGLRTRWTLLLPPDRQVDQIVCRYFNAWRRQDTKLVENVFTDDAIYMYHPFKRPLRGRLEIARYWREEVLTQEAPRITVNSLTTTGDHAVIEWTARFQRDAREVAVRGMMVLRLDVRSGQIAELREYYHSNKLPITSAT